MITHGNAIEVLAGNSNRPLAEAVAAELKLSLSNAEVGKFSVMDALRYLVEPENLIAKAQLASAYQSEILCKEVDLNTLLLNDLNEFLPAQFVEEIDSLRLMPLFELLEKLSSIFQLTKIRAQEAYLFAFHDAVNEYLQKHSSELSAFITHWEEKLCFKTIPSGEIEGIRILSIHKSKGLEFHTVFLPFCDWKLENERMSYVWCSPQEAPFNELQLLPINYGTSMNESIYHTDEVLCSLVIGVNCNGSITEHCLGTCGSNLNIAILSLDGILDVPE